MSETLGYVFHPQPDPHALGYRGLGFNLYARPTEWHFDPEQATLTVVQHEGGTGRLTLKHPWEGATVLRVCAGHVELRDRRDQTVEAFTLGGELRVADHGDHTACDLTSTAPLFEVAAAPGIDVEDAVGLLIEEIEALLALRSAHWVAEPGTFEGRLAAVEPALLYAVALATIDERIHHIPIDRRPEQYRLASMAVHTEIRRLRDAGTWPATVPQLDAVL